MSEAPDAAIANNPALQRNLAGEGLINEPGATETGPKYRIMADSKIPVSKELGKIWSSRLDQARAARGDIESAWSEAVKYYQNDQSAHRTDRGDRRGGSHTRRKIGESWTETENVVFANVSTELPMLYAKNPQITATAHNDVDEGYVKCSEALVNTLLSMKHGPGVALKGKARRGVLWGLLANSAYMKTGFTLKENSTEQAISELRDLSKQYETAKGKELKALEGKIAALEEKVSLLTPSGPFCKLVSPFRMYIGPSVEADHSDAPWIIEEDYLPTAYMNAVYGKDKDGQVVSVYEPNYILNADAGVNSVEDEVNNFSLFNKTDEAQSNANHYGYKTTVAFKNAQYTKVFWVWDKVTRRLLLFADNKWEWPVWVWDDPNGFLDFYPYDVLHFHEDVEGAQPKGEVTYYLDQQDAINDINSTVAQARDWARFNVVADKNAGMSQDDVQQIISGPNGTVRMVDVPEGKSLKDVITTLVPPAMAHPELFQIESKLAAIGRLTGINDAQRGGQFKTNTTNGAVQAYQQNTDIRIDEKIDAIEDWIGSIAWKVLQAVATKFSKEQVTEIVGAELGQHWVKVNSVEELRSKLYLRVVGGSTEKPTSKNKKKRAIEFGQIMGQFGAGLPAVAIVTLKVLERAFSDEVEITPQDWKMIMDSLQAEQQNQGGTGGGGEPAAQPGQEGQQPVSPEQQAQIAEMIKAMPPEQKHALEVLVQHGVPPTEALKRIQAQSQGQQAPQPQAK